MKHLMLHSFLCTEIKSRSYLISDLCQSHHLVCFHHHKIIKFKTITSTGKSQLKKKSQQKQGFVYTWLCQIIYLIQCIYSIFYGSKPCYDSFLSQQYVTAPCLCMGLHSCIVCLLPWNVDANTHGMESQNHGSS